MARGKFIAYYRVSTVRQGRSGLGLDAQRDAVLTYLNGGNWDLVAEFSEVESGKKSGKDRPELVKALSKCRAYGAKLIVAKLDRLTRDVGFWHQLKQGKTKFVAADYPDVNETIVDFLILFADIEGKLASSRTKAALAAAKRRGVKLGNPANLSEEGRTRGQVAGHATRSASADQTAADLADEMDELRQAGIVSLKDMADALTAKGIPTPSRKDKWYPMQVARVLQRIEREAATPTKR